MNLKKVVIVRPFQFLFHFFGMYTREAFHLEIWVSVAHVMHESPSTRHKLLLCVDTSRLSFKSHDLLASFSVLLSSVSCLTFFPTDMVIGHPDCFLVSGN